jgi:hypothetical protein
VAANSKSKSDNFLADAIQKRDQRITYVDGFRFGFGFFMAGLLVALILGGAAWGVVKLMHLG